MHIDRRQFASSVALIAGSAAAVYTGLAAFESARAANSGIWERRVYGSGSALPPLDILIRHGIRPASVKPAQNGTAYIIPFSSPAARVKAWDGFNADEDWRALREAGKVAVQEIRIAPLL